MSIKNRPKCHEKLRIEPYRDKQYLICFYCEGTWVGQSELDTDLIVKNLNQKHDVTELSCPCCVNHNLNHAVIAGIELEYCSKCSGVFFDKGELELLSPNFKNINGQEVAKDTIKALAVIYLVSRAVQSFFNFINSD